MGLLVVPCNNARKTFSHGPAPFGCCFFRVVSQWKTPPRSRFRSHWKSRKLPVAAVRILRPARTLVGSVIFMDDRKSNDDSRGLSVRDRRFCIRYPFAADAVVLDLETGSMTDGVTSDLSMGGIFVCTSKPLPSNTRVRITLTRKDQKVEALGMVRIVKSRIGMGIEFLDLEQPHYGVLCRWVEQLTKAR